MKSLILALISPARDNKRTHSMEGVMEVGQVFQFPEGQAEVTAVYPPVNDGIGNRLVVFKPRWVLLNGEAPIFSRFVRKDGTVIEPEHGLRRS